MWFPRPGALADLRIASAPDAPHAQQWLFELFQSDDAVEWRQKVGVVSPMDGSAKSSTRLLCCKGWVLKTNLDSASASEDEVLSEVARAAALAARSRFWHPGKVWASYRVEALYYPLSVTPELETLRRLQSAKEKFRAWTQMLELSVDVAQRDGVGLDLNPANFGHDEDRARIYYLDEEWYPELRFSELAGACVGRIPEEPNIGESEWTAWGKVLFTVLQPLCSKNDCWDQLLHEIGSYPVAERFGNRRAALRDGFRSARTQSRRRGSSRRKSSSARTAVFGDVHGNLPALEAVLEACRNLGVDSYLFLGDAVGYGPFPRECVQRLAELPDSRCVRGNHDHAIGTGVLKEGMNRLARSCAEWTDAQLSSAEKEWLLSQPLDQRGSGWIAVHGAPKDPRRFLAYVYELTFEDNLECLARQHLRLCFCGHTHVQYVHEKARSGENRKLGAPLHAAIDITDDRVLLVNPGSVGQPRDGDRRAAFAIWDRGNNAISLHRAEYAIDRVVQASMAAGLPPRLGERLLSGV